VPVDPVHWLSRPAPGAGPVALLRIFVRRCHGGLGSSRACRESANQKTEGQSAFGAVKFSGAAKAKRRRHYPWLTRRSLANRRLTLAPRRTCCFAPNICSSLPWWLGFIPVTAPALADGNRRSPRTISAHCEQASGRFASSWGACSFASVIGWRHAVVQKNLMGGGELTTHFV
jgi:hypothetical protein